MRSASPGKDTPRVSVVIPVLNAASVLPTCLDAIARQAKAPPFEVIVIDNGSQDDTAREARAHRIGPRVIAEAARGPYAARNAGIAAATGEVIAFTDADCEPEPGWLRAGVVAIDLGADLVGGSIVQRASTSPTVWERYDRALYLDQRQYVTDQGFAATANLFVRRRVFEGVGEFRPELVASGDVEFGRRASDAGFRLAFSPDACVLHRPRDTMRETWRLHRKLGSGFAELARNGIRPRPWRDPALKIRLGTVVDAVAADGPALRRRHLAPVHLVAMAARWIGRLTGRG